MALERQSIEKKDFPIGRRGYDPDAVDAHLTGIAEEVEELKLSARRRTETLASAASEQVRMIVEAAESSAAEIQRQAEEEAREIRADASTEAQNTREHATEQARDYVGKVSESTATMLQRLDAMESELGALIESLRTGSNRLNADLQLLEGNLTEVRDAVGPRPRFEPEPDPGPAAPEPTAAAPEPAAAAPEPPAAAPEPAAAAPEEPGAGGDMYEEQLEDEVEAAPYHEEPPMYEPPPAREPAYDSLPDATLPSHPGDGADDTEGARLIALNMALNGTPREETDRYLAENFQLSDRHGLLDEVYASIEG